MDKIKAEMVLVDDNNDSINKNYPFAIKIEAFEGNQKDKCLPDTFEKLLKFYHWFTHKKIPLILNFLLVKLILSKVEVYLFEYKLIFKNNKSINVAASALSAGVSASQPVRKIIKKVL